MMQPTLSASAELKSLLVRYDCGAMPPGVAARVSTLCEMLEIQIGADDAVLLMTAAIDKHPEDRCRELAGRSVAPLLV